MIIARKKELETLRSATSSEYSSFIAVYGRRRVGKTFLIREAFNYNFVFQHAGIYNGSLSQQLEAFMSSLRSSGYSGKETPSNWMGAFDCLKRHIASSRKKKKVVFIDELSWMDTFRSDLMQALEFFWNSWASGRKDIVLIVCASATSWMIRKVVHNKGGLYNRLTSTIQVKPFTLAECEEYTSAMNLSFNRMQIAEFYMVAGGVPYYWCHLKRGKSLSQNIDSIFFASDAPLKSEFQYLFASLFDAPAQYLKVVGVLSTNKAGMDRDELLKRSGLSNGGGATTVLEDLESSGFIRRYAPFGRKVKNSLYQLIDNFTLFHYKFLATPPSDGHFWQNNYNSPSLNSWRGLAFERIALLHSEQIKQTLGISGILSNELSWSCEANEERGINGMQIDLLIDRNDKTINICEAKFCQKEYLITKDYEQHLRTIISDFQTVTGTRKAIQLTLITSYGILPNKYSSIVQSEIKLDDLFCKL